MLSRLFKNRGYQIYFELLDSFQGQGCPLCDLLSKKEQAAISRFVGPICQGEKRAVSLLELCPSHRIRAREILGDGSEAAAHLKKIVAEELRVIADCVERPQRPIWRRGQKRLLQECPLCHELLSQDRVFCKALVHCLDEMDFWKRFQSAPLLCRDHLRRCTAPTNDGQGFTRLVEDQRVKLNVLLDDLIRFTATGGNAESKKEALEWLADPKGPALTISPSTPSGRNEDLTELSLDAEDMRSMEEKNADPEALRFENEKLKKKIEDLTNWLGKVETRAASLHYRVAELSEVNKRLEMGYTGANALANGLEKMVQNLKEEIKKLKDGSLVNSSKQGS